MKVALRKRVRCHATRLEATVGPRWLGSSRRRRSSNRRLHVTLLRKETRAVTQRRSTLASTRRLHAAATNHPIAECKDSARSGPAERSDAKDSTATGSDRPVAVELSHLRPGRVAVLVAAAVTASSTRVIRVRLNPALADLDPRVSLDISYSCHRLRACNRNSGNWRASR